MVEVRSSKAAYFAAAFFAIDVLIASVVLIVIFPRVNPIAQSVIIAGVIAIVVTVVFAYLTRNLNGGKR